jgi:hypothetical protein
MYRMLKVLTSAKMLTFRSEHLRRVRAPATFGGTFPRQSTVMRSQPSGRRSQSNARRTLSHCRRLTSSRTDRRRSRMWRAPRLGRGNANREKAGCHRPRGRDLTARGPSPCGGLCMAEKNRPSCAERRSICRWIGILAASPRRWMSRRNPTGLIGPPRSEPNTWASGDQ